MFNIEDISNKILRGETVKLSYKFTNDKILQDFHSFLVNVLSYFDQLFLIEVGFTIMKEILYNASKANAKRLFFQRENLDITNPDEYAKGMEKFSEEVTLKWPEQEQYLNQSGLSVDFYANIKNSVLYTRVENNVGVLPEEQARINKRIESAQKYNDLSDAFADISDTTESAGLGLVLTQILLKNSGIGKENFKLEFQKDKTIAHFNIPSNIVPKVFHTRFNAQILSEIEGLPPLPQSVNKIIALCNKEDTDINVLTSEIEKDAVLSADLLKLSNSSLFITRNKANTVLAAVKVVGMKNIKNMLYVSGVRKIMGNRYDKVQTIWDHCGKCSFFAKIVASDHGKNKISDIAATGGLLHDIGKLIILSLDRTTVKFVENLQLKEKESSVLLEEMSFGISHTEIGAILLEKWAFPTDLISIVRYHHKPLLSPPEYKEILEIVYLANMMLDCLEGKSSFYSIEPQILKTFKLDSEEVFNKYIEKVNKQFLSNTAN
jgi:putative nucleotidyltransferase with HDIG domain